MICPFCSSPTKIYNSRKTHQGTQTWRRHRCKSCGNVFTTIEKPVLDGVINIIDEGVIESYSRERMLLSLIRVSDKMGLPTGTINELVSSIEDTLRIEGLFSKPTQEKSRISELILTVITRFNKNMALQYLNQIHNNKPPLEAIKKITQGQ